MNLFRNQNPQLSCPQAMPKQHKKQPWFLQ